VRYLILSDIHSNLEALQAVLEASVGEYDVAACCGDLVGYCADPSAVTGWARRSLACIVRGNHDKACSGGDSLEWFNPVARASALWTYGVLRPEELEYLQMLPKGPADAGGFQIMHGSPLDEDEYVINAEEIAGLAQYLEAPVSFFGHTHLQGGFRIHRNGVRAIPPVPPGQVSRVIQIEEAELFVLNPGSVGQPRDGDPRAAYAIYIPEERLVELRRAEYDVGAAQTKILAAGLPEVLARRLALGR
jgi:predicted phosphodiesterase